MSFAVLMQKLNELNIKKVTLLCHHNADPDALCSAYAIATLLKHFEPDIVIEIGAPQGMSRLSKRVLKYLPIDVTTKPQINNTNALILLDTNTISQLNDMAEKIMISNTPVIIIDHHAPHPKTMRIATLSFIDAEATSTCEIVYNFFEEMGVQPDENVAKALFLGIAFDTRHFLLARSTTFQIIANLQDYGVNVQEVLPILSLPMDFSERVARLKASKRLNLLKVRDWIIAFSRVSSFQASAARAIICSGSHVAVVVGQKNGNLKISLRCTPEFHAKTGIHLGKDIAQLLGDCLHGMGGGHATAAGVNGYGEVEMGFKLCLRFLIEKLR